MNCHLCSREATVKISFPLCVWGSEGGGVGGMGEGGASGQREAKNSGAKYSDSI